MPRQYPNRIIDRLRYRPDPSNAANLIPRLRLRSSTGRGGSAGGPYYGGLTHGGITNPGTGMGTNLDKSEGAFFTPTRIYYSSPLEILFVQSWAAANFVNIPVDDMFSQYPWRTWLTDNDADADRLMDAEKRHKVTTQLAKAMKAARQYGTGVLVLMTGEDDPTEPLIPERIRPGDLKNLLVLHRYELSIPERDYDMWSPNFGGALYYDLHPSRGNYVLPRVHYSRVLRFDGILNNTDSGFTIWDSDWGVPELIPVLASLLQDQGFVNAIAHLAQEASIPVLGIANLGRALSGELSADDPGAPSVEQIGASFNMAKSIWRMAVIDKNTQEFSRVAVAFGGLAELFDRFEKRVAAAAKIPLTRWMGMSPAGLNATGESDMHNYAATVESLRSKILVPQLDILDQVLARDAGLRGGVPEFEWRSMLERSDEDAAKAEKVKVEAVSIAVQNSMIDEDEGREILSGGPVFGVLQGPAPEPEPDPTMMGGMMGDGGSPPAGPGAVPPRRRRGRRTADDGRRRGRRRGRLMANPPPVRPRVKDAKAYERALRTEYFDPVVARYKAALAQAESANDAWRAMNRAVLSLNTLPPADVLPVVAEHLARMEAYHRARIIKTFQAALGVDVAPFLTTEPALTFMRNKVVENVGLIKTIGPRFHGGLSKRLREELAEAPFDKQRLNALLRDEYKSSGYNLRRLTRDQTSKTIGGLTEVRQTQLGVEKYEWITSGDNRVRRSHANNNGLFFEWANPPETGHPGSEIQCRCIGIADVTSATRQRLGGKPETLEEVMAPAPDAPLPPPRVSLPAPRPSKVTTNLDVDDAGPVTVQTGDPGVRPTIPELKPILPKQPPKVPKKVDIPGVADDVVEMADPWTLTATHEDLNFDLVEEIVDFLEGGGSLPVDRPVIVWQNKILDGHHRVQAAMDAGIDAVPVLRLADDVFDSILDLPGWPIEDVLANPADALASVGRGDLAKQLLN